MYYFNAIKKFILNNNPYYLQKKIRELSMVNSELKIDNYNFIKKCQNQAKKIFYETKTPVSHEILNTPLPSLYHIEINSHCNLKCKFCISGNNSVLTPKYGIMNLDYFRKVCEKIKIENKDATILVFGNSEPFLNKNIVQYIKILKDLELKCTISSNLNVFKNVEQTIKLCPDSFIISVSGYSQDIYSRAHRGGNIEVVKENMDHLSQIIKNNHLQTNIVVNYHLYTYNWKKDFDDMKKFSHDCGFSFTANCARSISMEMTLEYMHRLEKEQNKNFSELPFCVNLPIDFSEEIETLIVKPDDIFAMYKNINSAILCPFSNFETFIRYDGSVQLCGCCSDARLTIADDYINTTNEEIQKKRRWHPFCEVCLRTKTYLYFNMVDLPKWDSLMVTRFPEMPCDRLVFGGDFITNKDKEC